ncbi:MAG TPA: PAS domain S-box protein [Candidatus Ozemobacteraceae bacterium]|nr:PAS domain S-box protein [Candidatus Ozemobacteraceae bacterium]
MTTPSETIQELLQENIRLKQRIRELERVESGGATQPPASGGQDGRNGYQQCDEGLLAEIVRHSSELINLALPDGTMVFLNDAGANMLGIDPEAVATTNFMQVIPDHLKDLAAKEIIPSTLENGCWEGELQYLNLKTRDLIDVHAVTFVISGPEAGQRYLANISLDIRQRKKTEEELHLFRNLVEHSTDAIGISRPDGTHYYQNEALDRLLGNVGEHPPETVYLDKDMGNRVFETIMAGGSIQEETKMLGRDGSILDVFVRAYSILSPEGRVIGLVGLHTDITARKKAEEALRQSEQRFRGLVENATDLIFALTPEGVVTYLSPNWRDHMGEPPSQAVGKPLERYLHPDDIVPYRDMLNRIPTTGTSVESPELRVMRKDGATLWYSCRMSALRDSQGKISGFMGIARDITGTKIEALERQKLQEQLFHSQKLDAVGQLAGGVAHDFNNMLSVIIGNTDLALRELGPDAPLRQPLQDILAAGRRSANLTRQLLAFARKQNINPRVLGLNDAVAGVLSMLQRLIGENINLVWRPGHELWMVRIDPSQIDQILANLTVNARDAISRTGTITIETLNVRCDEAYCADSPECVPGDYVQLSVADNGCGIAHDLLPKIFDPFFTTKKEGRGTGLGLSTVYGIVKQNGGFINVCSDPGIGSTFRIHLPRHRIEAKESPGIVEEARPVGGRETILVVEDEATVLHLTRKMLENLGYRVLSAENPEQAMKLAREYDRNIDLLLTDVVMPGTNGKELSERILEFMPGLKHIYMSGYTSDVIARQAILDEGVKFISKPFSLKELADKVRETLDA